MWRRFSRWAVTLLGLALAGGGAAAIANGWGMIQIERGWSLFIGGAAALAGGAVVLGIGQVLLRLDELVVAAQGGVAERASAPLVARSAARKPEPPDRRAAPIATADAAAREQFSSSGSEGIGARRRRINRSRSLYLRRHHLRDVFRRRRGSSHSRRIAALCVSRGIARAGGPAILGPLNAPDQNKRRVAGNPVGKADNLRRETETSRFQFVPPAVENIACLAPQRVGPAPIRGVDRATAIPAKLGGEAQQDIFLESGRRRASGPARPFPPNLDRLAGAAPAPRSISFAPPRWPAEPSRVVAVRELHDRTPAP